MDGAHVAGTEHVAQVGRDGGETAAVHAEDDGEAGDEQRHAADGAGVRHQGVQHDSEDEEAEIGVPPSDQIGGRGPEEPARAC